MSRITLEKITSVSALSDIMEMWAFCKSLPEYATNGFCWPKTLMDTGSINSLKDALDEIEAGEGFTAENMAKGFVPQEIWWVRDEKKQLIGLVKLRSILTPALLRNGGHIGLGLVEDARGQGYGTEVLTQVLGECHNRGIQDVLLTTSVDNAACRALIEKCGGKLWDEISDGNGGRKARYWIQSHALHGQA